MKPKPRLIAYTALGVLLVALPFLFGSYRVGQFTLVAAFAVAVLGLNLLVGYAGQISLGHGALFALGAYTTAILMTETSVPALATVPIAAAVSFAAGLLLGLPALRVRGLYLALITLGVAVAVPQLIKRFDGLTGGTQGLSVSQPTAPGWTGLADDQWLYFVVLAIALVMFVLAARMVRGRVGRAMIAVRENETTAQATGVHSARTKTLAFATGSMYAGVGGALYVFAIGFVAPESFTLVVSFSFLAAIVVGGLATIGGAVFGALFIEFVPVYAGEVNDALAGVIYGAVLIAFMYALPGGVMGALRKGLGALRRDGKGARRKDAQQDGLVAGGVVGSAGDGGGGRLRPRS